MVDLPGDVSERAVTVEEVMQKNLGHGSWPTAEVVILPLHQFPGASIIGPNCLFLQSFFRRVCVEMIQVHVC